MSMQNKNKALVTLCPVPFVNSQKEFFYYDGENTVAELLSKARVPASCVLQVYLNGHLVKEGYYEEAVVKPGNVLLVRIFPQGSKEDRKNIFRVAAFVYLGIAAQQWGESVGFALGASAKSAYAIGSAVITFGGTLLINALIPPPVKAVQARAQDTRDDVYNITGIQNKADPYAPVPIIYGKTKRFPQYAARPFTTVEGNDQILHCLFCIGHAETPADLILSDLKIGDTSIEDYEGVSWEYWGGRPAYREVATVEGPRTSLSIPIFPNRVSEAVGVKIERGDGTGWTERTTATDTNSIIVDIEFPQLVGYNTESGARFSRAVEFEIQYKKTTDTTYEAFDPIQNETIVVDDAYVQNLNTPRRNYGVATFGESILVFGGTSIATGAKLDTIERFDGDSWTVLGHTLPVPAASIGAVKTSYAYYYIFGPDFGANIYVLFDSGVVNLSLTIGVAITTSRGFMASGDHPAGPFSTYYRSVLFLENQTVGSQTGLYSVEIVHREDTSAPADGFVAGPNGSLITTVRGMCPLYSGAPSLLIQEGAQTVWYKVKFDGLWNGRRQASLTVASYNMRRIVSGQTYIPVDMTAVDNANIHKSFVLYERWGSGSTLVGYAVGRMDAFGNGEVTDIVAFGTPEPSAALQVVPYYVRLSGNRISYRWMVCGDTMRGTSGDGVKTVTGASNATVRASFAMDGLETGQYNVRIRRVTADNTATNIADEMYWAQIVSQREGSPVLKYDAAYLYLKVRASNQLSGMLSNFNCMVEARHWVPDLSGSEITYNKEFTQNPAWAYLMLLTSTACKTPLPYTKVDIEGLQEFADFCDTNGFTFNYVFDRASTSVYDYSRIALSAGRATPAFRDDGKYSLVVDDVRENYVHIFTPRNSWGFSGTKSFSKIPHALRCNFINEDEDYQQDERVVYSGSYTEETATEYETMNLEGITDAEHVFKIGKYFLNAAALRPEVFELKSDPESFPCTRGDRVEVVSDVALIGMGCGRIRGYDTNIGGQITTIYTDNKIATEAGTDYVMRIRLPELPGEYAEHVVRVDATAENDTFIPQAPLPLASVEIMNGLFILGLEDCTTFPCVVKSIEYSTMLEATLTLVPYDPNIFSLGTIPAFDSRITSTIEIEKGFPEKPVLHEVGGSPAIASDEFALELMPNGVLRTRVIFSLEPISSNRVRPDYVRVALRRTGDTESPWTQEAPQSVESGVAIAYAVEDGVSYDFKIRYETAAGLASDWLLVEDYEVIGKTTPPPDVTGLAYSNDNEGTWLVWDQVVIPDFWQYEVRVGGTEWADATFYARIDATEINLGLLLSGTYTYRVKAVDVIKLSSVTETTVTVDVGNPSTPLNLSAQAIISKVILDWGRPDSTYPIAFYRVYKKVSGAWKQIAEVQATYLSHEEFAGGSYEYGVVAYDAAGNASSMAELQYPVIVLSPLGFENYQVIDRTFERGEYDGQTSILPWGTYFSVLPGYLLGLPDLPGDLGGYVIPGLYSPTAGDSTWYYCVVLQMGFSCPQDAVDAGYGDLPALALCVKRDVPEVWPPPYSISFASGAEFHPWYDFIVRQAAVQFEFDEVYNSGFEPIMWNHWIGGRDWISPEEPYQNVLGYTGYLAGWNLITHSLTFQHSDFSLSVLKGVKITVDILIENYSGTGTANAADAGGTEITFPISMNQIKSLIVTPKTSSNITLVAQEKAETPITGFIVFAFDSDGDRTDCDFYWEMKGF